MLFAYRIIYSLGHEKIIELDLERSHKTKSAKEDQLVLRYAMPFHRTGGDKIGTSSRSLRDDFLVFV